MKMQLRGVCRIAWTFAAGARTFSVDVYQPLNLSPRPTMVVRANGDAGIRADVTGTAASGAGWVTITVNVSPIVAGTVWVDLFNNLDRLDSVCWFDKLRDDTARTDGFDAWIGNTPVLQLTQLQLGPTRAYGSVG